MRVERERPRRAPGREVTAALAVAVVVAAPSPAPAQQVADSAFTPLLGAPAYAEGRGPRVALDEAHHNFHTLDGRYLVFGRVLGDDGFQVSPFRQAFTPASLSDVDVLVVANALAAENASGQSWRLPTPSAFTAEEIGAVEAWVRAGGALLLVADHMPFPGAAQDLAAAFGFQLRNGFAMKGGTVAEQVPLVFRRADGSLADHAVTRGGSGVRVDSVATFTGEAFRIPAEAISLLTLPRGIVSLDPDTAWVFHEDTPVGDVSGWSQGAVLEWGRGRLAVFGEAAMFSAQLQTREDGRVVPMGMNAPVAAQNPAFLLNLMRWLAGDGWRR